MISGTLDRAMLNRYRSFRAGAAPAISAIAVLLSGCTYAPHATRSSERVVTEVARFEGDQVTGVAVSRTGRLFASFPNWHPGHRVHVVEVEAGSGASRAFPDGSWNDWTREQPVREESGARHWICVQSVYVDALDRLWVLDPAAPGMAGLASGARPKLVCFDLATNQPERTYFFDESVCPGGSYLNDVRIDVAADHAYITDSSLGGLVVLNLASGDARRVLADHPSTRAEPNVVLACEGRELRMAGGPNAGGVPQVHSDGIALDASRGWLYWQALTARTLYRIPASLLRDAGASDADLAAAIENLGPTVATDGMEIDAQGNVYFSAFERDAVVVRTPEGALRTIASSPRFAWPDSFALAPDGTLYFTTAQIHRSAWFNADGAMPDSPYRIFKIQPPASSRIQFTP